MKSLVVKKPKLKVYDDNHFLTVKNGLRKYKFNKHSFHTYAYKLKWIGFLWSEPCSVISSYSNRAGYFRTVEDLYYAKKYEKLAYFLLAYVRQYKKRKK